MKSLVITAMWFLTLTVGANAQENQKVFAAEEEAIVDLSNSKWDWMSEKNVERLAELLETIRTGSIWYKKAEIHDVQVKFAAGTATVYSRIHLNSVVGGNSVRFPFIVTEVYPNPNFTGEVWLAPLTEKKELNVPMANVTFEPGCRNSWHSHKAGQLLIATAGIGNHHDKARSR